MYKMNIGRLMAFSTSQPQIIEPNYCENETASSFLQYKAISYTLNKQYTSLIKNLRHTAQIPNIITQQ